MEVTLNTTFVNSQKRNFQKNKLFEFSNKSVMDSSHLLNKVLCIGSEYFIFRDLKPANILISNGNMKIGDFGFAKKNKTGVKNQTAVGTPLYMSV